MDAISSVDSAPKAPEDLSAQARVARSAALSWSADAHALRCVIGWPGARPALVDVLPLFQHLGLELVDHRPVAAQDVAADVFGFRLPEQSPDGHVLSLLGGAFLAAWERRCDRDEFAALVPRAHLNIRQVQLVRVAFQYLRQAGLGASRSYVLGILTRHREFVRTWVELFEARFAPGGPPPPEDRLDRLVESAATHDEDRVLRWYASFGRAVTRTSYFHLDGDGGPSSTIVVKLDPAGMPFPTDPAVWVETFVHHPDVEGLHVRCGRVARGGLRWSDRLEDYRSEVLALVKAQHVKNALIVPDGAKGTFVVKAPMAGLDRATAALQVRRCYRLFVRGLLDITDNVVDGTTRNPPGTVVFDDDDPYLVVAADKGTAAFSDLANAEAAEGGFWLGDAFASGGSAGFDHKRFGVTARGAWESVRRHFVELGTHVDSDDFTVVGIGDMSGDVFGNGMLLSAHIRLVAAFDHRHVFLDPDPDASRSLRERQRLAALGGSSWADYDPAVISPGGGVYPRSARVVALSEEVRRRLGVTAEHLPPDDVVRAILRAPVDLLWNGGIGTYVKASTETDAEIGDHNNDRVRVSSPELRCRVVAEGGNLGLTQAARIEYALAGGRVNADFVDNAGGVNTSDREVNLKILLRSAVEAGALEATDRDAVLESCAGDVVEAVLVDNRRQTLAISVAEGHAPFLLDRHEQVIGYLEELDGLDRVREGLPAAEEIDARRARGVGLVRPEIAVLLAHAKTFTHRLIAAGDLPGDPTLLDVLFDYFPAPVRGRFADQIRSHPLAHEIIATRLANELLNRVGPGFMYRLEDRTGATVTQAARAFVVVRDVFGLEQLWDGLDALPLGLTMSVRGAMEQSVEHNACWLLRRRPELVDIAEERAPLEPNVRRLRQWLEQRESGPSGTGLQESVRALVERGAPAGLARAWCAVGLLLPAFDLASSAQEIGADVIDVAERYFTIGHRLRLTWVSEALPAGSLDSHWEQLAKAALRDEMCALQAELAADSLRAGDVDEWIEAHTSVLERARASYSNLADAPRADVAVLSVAAQVLRDIVHATCAPR